MISILIFSSVDTPVPAALSDGELTQTQIIFEG